MRRTHEATCWSVRERLRGAVRRKAAPVTTIIPCNDAVRCELRHTAAAWAEAAAGGEPRRREPAGDGLRSTRRALIGTLLLLATPVPPADAEPAVPWCDLVGEAELVVVARVVSLDLDTRLQRGVLDVEEALLGDPPARIVVRFRADSRPALDARVPAQKAELTKIPRGARVIAFLERRGERFAPVGGRGGIVVLQSDADRGFVAALLRTDRLALDSALPLLRRGGAPPSPPLLASVLAELDRQVKPEDARLLSGVVCAPGEYWPVVERSARRWNERFPAHLRPSCPDSIARSGSTPGRPAVSTAVAPAD